MTFLPEPAQHLTTSRQASRRWGDARGRLRIHELVAGLALVMSAATQLRIGGIGPGEALLGLASFHALATIARRSRFRPTRNILLYSVIVFYCGIVSLVPVLMASSGILPDEDWLRQYFFVLSALLYPLLLYIAYGPDALSRIALVFAIGVTAFFGCAYTLVEFLGIPGIADVSFNYSAARFRGWALNPNQTALVIGVAVPLILHQILEKGRSVILLGPLAAFGLVVGVATGSNALQVAWALGVGFALASNRELGRGYRILGIPIRSVFRSALVLLAATIIIFGGYWLVVHFEELYQGTGQGMAVGQGEVRLSLWRSAFDAFLERPLLGNGPGHFSGLAEPFQAAEAHNFLFDWMASYGLIGSVILAIYLVSISAGLIRQGSFSVLSIVLVVLAVSIFHFFGRHPVFWFALFFAGSQTFERNVIHAPGSR